ncbi:hypothetical protein BDN67DRAFT_965659 [Paxillus ammoniavirescens]|nr:hypothetical protein BDN67DRAFT_965659 [Paxillus ammoniavirescens]
MASAWELKVEHYGKLISMMHHKDHEYESAVTEGSDNMHDLPEPDSAVLTDRSDDTKDLPNSLHEVYNEELLSLPVTYIHTSQTVRERGGYQETPRRLLKASRRTMGDQRDTYRGSSLCLWSLDGHDFRERAEVDGFA